MEQPQSPAQPLTEAQLSQRIQELQAGITVMKDSVRQRRAQALQHSKEGRGFDDADLPDAYRQLEEAMDELNDLRIELKPAVMAARHALANLEREEDRIAEQLEDARRELESRRDEYEERRNELARLDVASWEGWEPVGDELPPRRFSWHDDASASMLIEEVGRNRTKVELLERQLRQAVAARVAAEVELAERRLQERELREQAQEAKRQSWW